MQSSFYRARVRKYIFPDESQRIDDYLCLRVRENADLDVIYFDLAHNSVHFDVI
jgi:hypothetical protein